MAKLESSYFATGLGAHVDAQGKPAAATSGRRKFAEADQEGMPIQYIDGVNRTLRIKRAQRDTADSFGLVGQMKLTTLMDVILVPEDPASVAVVQLLNRTAAERAK